MRKREMGERVISGGFCWEFLGITNKGLDDYKDLNDNGELDGLRAAGLRRTLMENDVQDEIYPMHPKLPKSEIATNPSQLPKIANCSLLHSNLLRML